MSNLTYQVRSRSILSYYKKSENGKFRSVKRRQSIENFKKCERYSGLVTDGSQKRLTRALENLVAIAKPKFFEYDGKTYPFRLNFVTLTLYSFSRRVPGREAHKTCLEPLLRWLREKGMTGYVWKAELQSKREDCHQLHYHLTTDIFIDLEDLRTKWNSLQRKAGYLDYFFEKFNHWEPNSTDVHATYNKKNLIGYLKKKIVRYSDKKKYQHLKNKSILGEMAKTDQNVETIEGKVWDCSTNVKTAYFEIQGYQNITNKIAQGVIDGEIDKREFDRCTVYEILRPGYYSKMFLPYPDRLFYDNHLEKMRNFERARPEMGVFSSS